MEWTCQWGTLRAVILQGIAICWKKVKEILSISWEKKILLISSQMKSFYHLVIFIMIRDNIAKFYWLSSGNISLHWGNIQAYKS